jgi:uncharacterized protein (DUF4415 family)
MSRSPNHPDNPPLTASELASARRGIDHLPKGMQDALRSARRGRGPQKAPKKEPVYIRLSPDVLARYKKAGPGWQRRINDDLVQLAAGHYRIVSAVSDRKKTRSVPKMHGSVLSSASAGRTKHTANKGASKKR